MIQDFLSHGISIPIGSSNKFTKKLVKMLRQNCQIDQSATTIADCLNPFRRRGRDGIIPTMSGEATIGRNYEFSTSHERQFQFTMSGEATSGRNCN